MAVNLLDLRTTGRQFVDRYELVGEIAAGGMATVYLARLTGAGGFQRMFALKRLHPHLQGDAEFIEMFLDEARLAAGIHHPNVVPILEVGTSQNSHYLVMEYIEGDTLAKILSRAAGNNQRIPAPQVLRIALDTLSGLHAAHETKDENGAVAGVVHRDVSPQNVLVGVDGISRITDFGVARAATRLSATRVGQLKGKIAYMAPEQARGEIDLDRRADVFAAGIVFWEALAHRRLFKAQNEAATLARVLQEPIPDLKQAAPHLSPALCRVVMKALERERERRIPTCAEFADSLERAAMASGEVGSSRDLKAYMDAVLGEEVRVHREAVRLWTAQVDAMGGGMPMVTPTGSSTNTAVETIGSEDLTQTQKSKGRSLAMVALLFVVAAGGVYGYQEFAKKQSAQPSTATGGGPEALGVPEASTRLPSAPASGKEKAKDGALSLSDVEEEQEEVIVAPAPRLAPAVKKESHQNGAKAGGTSKKKRSKDKRKDPVDELGSNPYR